MPQLDPAMAVIVEAMRARGLRPYETMTPAEARQDYEARHAVWNVEPPAVGVVEDRVVPGPRGPLRVRLYAPDASAGPGPGIVYLHGGGWVCGSPESHDVVCRGLALAGGFRVASVDYGLAPEHPFPHGLDDTLAAVRWLAAEGPSVGIDPARLAIAGDSAGANLALAACLTLRDAGTACPRAAALVYGVWSADCDSPSHRAFGDGRYGLTSATMRWYWDRYVPDPARRADPLVAPLHAELDCLRDGSEALAERLVGAGVDLDWRLWRGVTHGSFVMSRALPAARGFVAEVGDFLRRRLR